MHDVTVLDYVVLAFDTHLAGGADGGFRLVVDKVLILNYFCPDEAALEVRVDDTGGAGRLVPGLDGPGAAFVGPGREEGAEAQQLVCALDEAHYAALLEAHLFQEHLPVLIVLNLRDFSLRFGGNHQNLGVLRRNSRPDSLHVSVASSRRSLVYIAHIHHRLVGDEEQVLGHLLFFCILRYHFPAGMALLQDRLVTEQQGQQFFSLLVPAGSSHFLYLLDAVFHRLKVFDLQLCIHHLFVPHRVHGTVYMDDIPVIETAQHMQDGVGLADIGQKLVAQALPAGSPLHQAGNIHNFHGSGNGTLGLANVREHLQALVRHIGGTHIGVDGAERKIGALGLPGAYTVKQGGFANVGQSDDSTF